MKLELAAGILAGGLLLLSSSCSGKSESADFTDVGGTDSGGSAGSAQAGKSTSGGSTAAQAGKSATGGSSAGEAGSSSDGGSAGGASNPGQPDCDVDFDALDRSCSSPHDCVLVQHQIDCCGTILIMGLPSSEQPAFTALEQYCAAQFPLCGCAAQGMMLEDGSIIDFGSTTAVADCVDGRCQSRNSAATTACGDKRCTEAQYCEELVAGPAGSEPSYACRPLGDCQDCACLNIIGCQCSETGGSIEVFCAAP
jgi:hypothetical protein